jgi:hypothetical protein
LESTFSANTDEYFKSLMEARQPAPIKSAGRRFLWANKKEIN